MLRHMVRERDKRFGQDEGKNCDFSRVESVIKHRVRQKISEHGFANRKHFDCFQGLQIAISVYLPLL